MRRTFVRLLVDDYPACFRFYRDVMDSALAGLRARGAKVAAECADRSDWGIRVGYVRDPAENLIELNQPIPIKA